MILLLSLLFEFILIYSILKYSTFLSIQLFKLSVKWFISHISILFLFHFLFSQRLLCYISEEFNFLFIGYYVCLIISALTFAQYGYWEKMNTHEKMQYEIWPQWIRTSMIPTEGLQFHQRESWMIVEGWNQFLAFFQRTTHPTKKSWIWKFYLEYSFLTFFTITPKCLRIFFCNKLLKF